MPTEKDGHRVQQPRIAGLAQELNPSSVVEFDPKTNPQFRVEIKVIDGKTGEKLYASRGHWRYPNFADMTPERIKGLLRSWGAGKQQDRNP
jgi:hypothetical protein